MSDDGYVEVLAFLDDERVTLVKPGGSKVKVPQGKRDELVSRRLMKQLEAAGPGQSVPARSRTHKGRIRDVRARDEAPPARIPRTPPADSEPDRALTPEQKQALRDGHGVNPYTFVPAPPRGELRSSPFADAEPSSHACVPAQSWSGTLVFTVTTRTPMLLPDPEHRREDARGHVSYPLRVDEHGRPLLHGASVKGALRSAYETVTGSRFGVFRGHDEQLAYRQAAGAGSGLKKTVPTDGKLPDGLYAARVAESGGSGGLAFMLCDVIGVPRYPGRPTKKRKNKQTGGMEPWDPPPLALLDEAGEARPPTEGEWQDMHMQQVHGRVADHAVERLRLTAPGGLESGEKRWKKGWLRVTGRTIEGKYDEQLFVDSKRRLPLGPEHQTIWRRVVESYQDAARTHEPMPLSAGEGRLDPSHVSTEWVVGEGARDLAVGDLVYVDIAEGEVVGVQPSPLSRRLYGASPWELAAAAGLTPATTFTELSAADRLFGWVPTERVDRDGSSSAGYRGRLRVSEVVVEGGDGPDSWRRAGGTLAPLSSPKPSQFRFYGARDANGRPPAIGRPKAEGFRPDGGLRGRKHYWWPNDVSEDYWTPGAGAVDGRYREWQALTDGDGDAADGKGHQPTQTKTHDEWVRAGVTFAVTLTLDAVPEDDLAPLIWLLERPGSVLRFGGGKPYGFGAVDVAIDKERSRLWDGADQRERWLSLRPPEASPLDPRVFVEHFEAALDREPSMREVANAWRKVAAGTDQPVHYPRTTDKPQAEGYTWFVANERVESGKGRFDGGPVYGFALPPITDSDQRLPRLESKR